MTVLIVDDEPLVRRSLKKAFESKDHKVFEAEDGLLGLSKWEDLKPELVVLDILMPGLSGYEVLKKVSSATRAAAKVLLISAFSGRMDWDDKQDGGADMVLAKPFQDIFKVVEIGEQLLKGKPGGSV